MEGRALPFRRELMVGQEDNHVKKIIDLRRVTVQSIELQYSGGTARERPMLRGQETTGGKATWSRNCGTSLRNERVPIVSNRLDTDCSIP